ncbi:hypothetical protein [Geotalea sp. SG265]|uniref:hypothetical protein n=1 Tax=Geotalea sp. SG265 TaxID=2922867 RepID=UPI001FAF3E07|nr:hypothetical protein [Geotalea sp. SG265]
MKILITTVTFLLSTSVFASTLAGTKSIAVQVSMQAYCKVSSVPTVDFGVISGSGSSSIPVTIEYECSNNNISTPTLSVGTSYGTFNFGDIGGKALTGVVCKSGVTDCGYHDTSARGFYNGVSYFPAQLIKNNSLNTYQIYLRKMGCAPVSATAYGTGVCDPGAYTGTIPFFITF